MFAYGDFTVVLGIGWMTWSVFCCDLGCAMGLLIRLGFVWS